MGLFSSSSRSSSTQNIENTTQGAEVAEGGAVVQGDGNSVVFSDFGAVNRAFDFANDFGQTVSDSAQDTVQAVTDFSNELVRRDQVLTAALTTSNDTFQDVLEGFEESETVQRNSLIALAVAVVTLFIWSA